MTLYSHVPTFELFLQSSFSSYWSHRCMVLLLLSQGSCPNFSFPMVIYIKTLSTYFTTVVVLLILMFWKSSCVFGKVDGVSDGWWMDCIPPYFFIPVQPSVVFCQCLIPYPIELSYILVCPYIFSHLERFSWLKY